MMLSLAGTPAQLAPISTSGADNGFAFVLLMLGVFIVATTALAGFLTRKKRQDYAVFSATAATLLILVGVVMVSVMASRTLSPVTAHHSPSIQMVSNQSR